MGKNLKRNPYKYDFRYMDNLTEIKDLKKSIIINIIILVSFFILYAVGFICGVIFIPKMDLPGFIVMFIVIGVSEAICYILCISAIIRAFMKIKSSKVHDEKKE